jgi:hypothetical protein
MTDFLADLGSQLDRAATDLAAGRRLRRGARVPIGAVAAMATVLAVAAAILALSGPGDADRRTTPATADDSLLGTLEVLRRPQTETDRGPVARAGLVRGFSADPALVRVLAVEPNGLPVLMAGPMDQELPKPFTSRSGVACVFYPDPVDGGGVGCSSAADIRAGRAIGSLGRHWYTVVPDGVARIRASWPAGETTVTVRNNFAEAEGDGWPETVTWLDSSGRTLATHHTGPAAPPPSAPAGPQPRAGSTAQ